MGCRLLSVKHVQPRITSVRAFFLEFVEKAPTLYGKEFMSLLVHSLIHICDDAEKYGLNVEDLSAFEFESYLGFISRLIRSPTHLVVQYCNRMEEAELYLIEDEQNDSKILKVIFETKAEVLKVKYHDMILGKSHPSNTVLLRNGVVCGIQHFKYVGRELFVVEKKFKKDLFWTPNGTNII
ncbi:hypothetical protein QAD02_013233 [Eretmocerus hayati]|uniref:Uncharacterized protein n=1 Tax=Eretmocerus hayati TaxID=131215 RepID=A0ACC2P317_9HYME|nr:hypothetical protein QAD02_013233 [Eretmocerus hayati]